MAAASPQSLAKMAIRDRQGVVDAGHSGGLFGPAEHVAEELRQVAEGNVLDVYGLDIPKAAIFYGGVHREHGHGQRERDERRDDERCSNGWH